MEVDVERIQKAISSKSIVLKDMGVSEVGEIICREVGKDKDMPWQILMPDVAATYLSKFDEWIEYLRKKGYTVVNE